MTQQLQSLMRAPSREEMEVFLEEFTEEQPVTFDDVFDFADHIGKNLIKPLDDTIKMEESIKIDEVIMDSERSRSFDELAKQMSELKIEMITAKANLDRMRVVTAQMSAYVDSTNELLKKANINDADLLERHLEVSASLQKAASLT